jgi:hypothetical protein
MSSSAAMFGGVPQFLAGMWAFRMRHDRDREPIQLEWGEPGVKMGQ